MICDCDKGRGECEERVHQLQNSPTHTDVCVTTAISTANLPPRRECDSAKCEGAGVPDHTMHSGGHKTVPGFPVGLWFAGKTREPPLHQLVGIEPLQILNLHGYHTQPPKCSEGQGKPHIFTHMIIEHK